MPSPSSPRHPGRWALLTAAVGVAALVLVVGPAVRDSGREAAPDSTAAAATVPATRTPTVAASTPVPAAPVPAGPVRPTAAATPAPIPDSASGRLAVVPGTAPATGPGTRISYRLEIEAGLPLDGPAIAAQVQRTLTDPRGWQPIAHVAFTRTAGPASFELILASPRMVDELCAPLDTGGELSCRSGDRVILNAKRWVDAVPWYQGHLDDYRAYLVNHEVGHRLGHGHKGCPAAGAPAPVMLQQSKSLYGCRPNPWPAVRW